MYKFITNKAEAYAANIPFEWATTDYMGMCARLGLKPITKGTFYRRIRRLATTYSYPPVQDVALKARVDAAVLEADLANDEHAISSKALTKWYAKEFYKLNPGISSNITQPKGAQHVRIY